MKTYILWCFLSHCAVTAALAQAAVPAGMTYQGRITDASGNPIPDGTGYEIEVRLYNTPVVGPTQVLLWGTRYSGVPVKSGAFNLILGSGGNPITGATATEIKTAFNAPSVYLGITTTKSATGVAVPSPTEILPRQQIFSTPFAFRADVAATVTANGILSAAIKDGEVKAADVAAGQINTAHIVDGNVTSAKIADGSIQAADIALQSITMDRLLQDFAVFIDERPRGTEGGTTIGDAWVQRTLNKVAAVQGNSVTLQENIFTLKSGVYLVEAQAPAYNAQRHCAVIRKSGTTEVVLRGTSEHAYNNITHSRIAGMITVTAASEQFELWHFAQDGGQSLGIPTNAPGLPEIYSMVKITRLR